VPVPSVLARSSLQIGYVIGRHGQGPETGYTSTVNLRPGPTCPTVERDYIRLVGVTLVRCGTSILGTTYGSYVGRLASSERLRLMHFVSDTIPLSIMEVYHAI
jgi:hypothetical protein